MARLHNNLGKMVSECQTILDFAAANDDKRLRGSGSVDNLNSKACKVPVKSPPSTRQCSVSYRPDALSVTKQRHPSTEVTTNTENYWKYLHGFF